MDDRPIEPRGALPEGRMTEQDAQAFRTLLARLENSLAEDRRAAAAARVRPDA